MGRGPGLVEPGQYAMFSDVKSDTHYRYIWESGAVSQYRKPSIQHQRQHVRFPGPPNLGPGFLPPRGALGSGRIDDVIADNYQGKPLNSPNDVAPHPDGSIWFTDPQFGGKLSEGHPDAGEGPTNPDGVRDPNIGNTGVGIQKAGSLHQQLPMNVYRWDPAAGSMSVVTEEQVPDPNGLCFSPDYKTLYVISTGPGPGQTTPGGKRVVYVVDVDGHRTANMRLFTDCMVDGVECGPDGMRADRAGNMWASSNRRWAMPA